MKSLALKKLGAAALSFTAGNLGINGCYRTHVHKRGGLLVLSYHAVVADDHVGDLLRYGNLIGVSEFDQQILEVQRVYYPIGIAELRDWWDNGRIFPKPPVLITFDDGLRNQQVHAAAVLRARGVPALFAICSGYAGGNRMLWPYEVQRRVFYWSRPTLPMPDSGEERTISKRLAPRIAMAQKISQRCKRISVGRRNEYMQMLRQCDMPELDAAEQDLFAFLSWHEIRELKKQGFAISSHTVEHPIMTQIASDQLSHELSASKAAIEQQVGGNCSCFVYPNGGSSDLSGVVVEAVRDAGYEFAFTVTNQFCSRSQDPLLLDRIYMPGQLSSAAFHVRASGFQGALKRLLT